MTALRKKVAKFASPKSYVFEYRGGGNVGAELQVTQIENPALHSFANWKDGVSFAAYIEAESSHGLECFGILDDNDQVISFLFTKPGHRLGNWFFSLGDRDFVIFAVNTHPSARGKRLAGKLTAFVADAISSDGSRVFLDCATWNVSAHKAFETAGFEKVREAPFTRVQ